MKIFFVVVLVLNLLFEAMAGVSLLLGLVPEAGGWGMNYGFAAIAIASAVVWLWPYRSNSAAVAVGSGLLLTFHIGLAISLGSQSGQLVPAIVHGVFGAMFLFFFLQREKWCDV